MGIVVFEDGSTYKLGSPEYSGWNQMPDKAIVRIEYNVGGRVLVLQDFVAYNHVVEAVMGGEIHKITKVLLMGRFKRGELDFKSLIMEIGVGNDRMSKLVRPVGQEYKNGQVAGWKRGRGGGVPKVGIK